MNDQIHDIITADDPEPLLWPVSYALTLLDAMAKKSPQEFAEWASEDIDAYREHVAEARRMCQKLEAAASHERGCLPVTELQPVQTAYCDDDVPF